MNKEEFLDRLRRSLAGEVPNRVIEENLFYYNGYIQDEIQKGRTESQVLEELGDPRLIARTIIDSETSAGGGGSHGPVYGGGYSEEGGYREAEPAYTRGNEQDQRSDYGEDPHFHQFNLSGRKLQIAGLVVLAVVILILVLVFWMIGGILSLLGPLLPVIFMVWLVLWFMRIFRR